MRDKDGKCPLSLRSINSVQVNVQQQALGEEMGVGECPCVLAFPDFCVNISTVANFRLSVVYSGVF